MKKQWKQFFRKQQPLQVKKWLYSAALLLLVQACFSTPFQSRNTTVFGTVTESITGLPVNSVEIIVQGHKGLYELVNLKTVKSDKDGKYTITIDVPKGFHSLNLQLDPDPTRQNPFKYKDFLVYLNKQQSRNCCRVDITSSTQYDFVLY